MSDPITINVESLYSDTETAKLNQMESYMKKAVMLAGEGNEVILTGAGPVWLYLKIAHALHGKARKLSYRSPVTGDLIIFDHNPY